MSPMQSREAYDILGLEEGTSLDIVKSTYKRLALKTHPDKNPDDAEATAQFQRVGEAYRVLQRHLEPEDTFPRQSRHFYSAESSDELDDDFYSDDDYYDDDLFYDLEAEMDFFTYFFSRPFIRIVPTGSARYRQFKQEAKETPEQYQARLAKMREEQDAAEVRRQTEAADKRAKAEMDRNQERMEAEERQKAKSKSKKAAAKKKRTHADYILRAQQQEAQVLRSTVFAAARSNDTARVKKGIWEEGVDASGGEIKMGGEAFVPSPVIDKQETLLHIAAQKGDVELVKWLDAHNAEVEERNAEDFTAFHIAVRLGHIPIIKYFLEAYPPTDPDTSSIYSAPRNTTVLSIAVCSCSLDVVQLIHENKLASRDDTVAVWEQMVERDNPKQEDIRDLFARLEVLEISPKSQNPNASTKSARESSYDDKGTKSKQYSPANADTQSSAPNASKGTSHRQDNDRYARGFKGRARGRGRGSARHQ